MPKVSYCCCGCSLRDGTIILLGIDIVFGFIGFLLNINYIPVLLLQVALMAIAGLALYGVFKEKPDFMIAHMIVQIIAFIVMVVGMVVFLFGGTAIILAASKMAGNYPGMDKTTIAADSFAIILLIELVIGALAGLQYYFFVVVYSLYTTMREGNTGHF